MAKKKISPNDLSIQMTSIDSTSGSAPQVDTTRNTCGPNTGCDTTTTDPTHSQCETVDIGECGLSFNCHTILDCETLNKCESTKRLCGVITRSDTCSDTVNNCLTNSMCGNTTDICLESTDMCPVSDACPSMTPECKPTTSDNCVETKDICSFPQDE